MNNFHELTKDDADKILSLHNAGTKTWKIAEITHIGLPRIEALIAGDMSVMKPYSSLKSPAWGHITEIAADHAGGATIRDLARTYSASNGLILRILDAAGERAIQHKDGYGRKPRRSRAKQQQTLEQHIRAAREAGMSYGKYMEELNREQSAETKSRDHGAAGSAD